MNLHDTAPLDRVRPVRAHTFKAYGCETARREVSKSEPRSFLSLHDKPINRDFTRVSSFRHHPRPCGADVRHACGFTASPHADAPPPWMCAGGHGAWRVRVMVGSHGERAPEGRRLGQGALAHSLRPFPKNLAAILPFPKSGCNLGTFRCEQTPARKDGARRPPSSLRSRRPSRAEPAMVWLDGTVQPVVTHLTGGSPSARAIHLFNGSRDGAKSVGVAGSYHHAMVVANRRRPLAGRRCSPSSTCASS